MGMDNAPGSKRVDDIDKARKMAEAEDPAKTEAKSQRGLADLGRIIGGGRNAPFFAEAAEKSAKVRGALAGHSYDIKKEHPDWDEKQIEAEAWNRIEREEDAA